MSQKWLTFIKQRTIHSRMFKKLFENLDKQQINLLLHTEIYWLSRGGVLNMVFELEGELQNHFQGKSMPDFAE
jgi:hypothetical protein